MNKIFALTVFTLIIALFALSLAFFAYTRNPQGAEIELTSEKPADIAVNKAESEGPIYTGTSNGFVIKFENGAVLYLSGDTCLFGDMKWVIHDYYKPDIALLSAGNVFTMDPIDAAFAVTWINPKYAAPYHYRIFPFLEQSPDRFVELVNQHKEEGRTRTEPIPLEEGVEQELEGVKITWLGHGGFFFISPTGTRILVDPWLTPNPGTPAKFKDVSAFENIDLLFITHGHLDHFDMDDMEKIVKTYNPVIFSQWEVMGYLQPKIPGQYLMMNKGGRITNDTLLKQGVSANMPDGMEITMVPAEHSSSAP